MAEGSTAEGRELTPTVVCVPAGTSRSILSIRVGTGSVCVPAVNFLSFSLSTQIQNKTKYKQ